LTSFQRGLDPRLLDGLRTLHPALYFSDGDLSENNHFGSERVFMVKTNLEAATFQPSCFFFVWHSTTSPSPHIDLRRI
jgi:hypothetical protein